MKVYAFEYCYCVHESSWATVSLHKTKEGAEKALNEHKENALKEFNELYGSDNNEWGITFGLHEDWCTNEVEILD